MDNLNGGTTNPKDGGKEIHHFHPDGDIYELKDGNYEYIGYLAKEPEDDPKEPAREESETYHLDWHHPTSKRGFCLECEDFIPSPAPQGNPSPNTEDWKEWFRSCHKTDGTCICEVGSECEKLQFFFIHQLLQKERARTIRELDGKYNKLCEEKVSEARAKERERMMSEFERAVRLFLQGTWNDQSEIQAVSPEGKEIIWGGIIGDEITKEWEKIKTRLKGGKENKETNQ